MQSLRNLIDAYEKWVAANPETVSDVETTSKWVSYFIAGRISDSNVVSELIYSLSNMLVLYNDRILDKAKMLNTQMLYAGASTSKNSTAAAAAAAAAAGQCETMSASYRLKVMLTTLEYSEVFLEISAKRLFGNKGKWLLITLIQVVKAIGRYFILKHSTEQIITSPAMPSLNRREYVKQQKNGFVEVANATTAANGKTITPEQASYTFQLKRSGRVIRKVEGAPPLQYRDFKLNSTEQTTANGGSNVLSKKLLQAEYWYIAKPLIHLASMRLFGRTRWQQYCIALSIDILSIRMYYRRRHLMTTEQKRELSRRVIQLLMYLMRTPFFEKYSERRINRILDFVANHVPIAKVIAGPIKDYIPHWQSTYFYLWST